MRTDKIGINISRLRIERGITQEQLGQGILDCTAFCYFQNIVVWAGVCQSVGVLCAGFSELFGVKVDTILSDNLTQT